MREIKFRAWDKRDNRMYSVFPNWCFSLDGDIFDRANPLIDLKKVIEVQQYTGLKDKNGVEIYEGDILKVGFEPYTDEDEDGNDIDTYAETWNTKVSWSSDGGYVLNAPAGHDFWGEYNSTLIGWAVGDGEYELEVIGNIYENPELLERL